ncbi:hypothetical protein [Actinoallomurus iriomotensis]|uniref:DUF1152 domain-containing protein n=1 Tax=Actinoallomurus iriomotensis TaxID=478107 RepID=A0A9W6VNX1_9ACTN|nr:hypothetical protein [Actinoallomurus iriomotensis]GLY74199.1 hypothetical protein Airi01_024660 [Actinoallomurus iriomotensis]
MPSLHEPPLFGALRGSGRVLAAGAGGGFDVYAGLPLAFALMGLGKSVHLANLSFSALDLIDADDWCEPNLAAITPVTRGHDRYFLERTLARRLEAQGMDSTVYAFPRTVYARCGRRTGNWCEGWTSTPSCWSTAAPTF